MSVAEVRPMSRTTPDMAVQLRRVGASAREALLEQQALVDACQELRADADVLHAMLAECRVVLVQNSE